MTSSRGGASPEFYLDQALASFEQARRLIDRDGSPVSYGVVQHDIAEVHERSGRLADALEHYRDAAAAKRTAAEHGDLDVTLTALASCLIEHAEFAEARAALDEAGELLSRPGVDIGRRSRAKRVYDVGLLYERLGACGENGAYAKAMESFTWSLDLYEFGVGDAESCSVLLRAIARTHRAQGHLHQAADTYVEAVRVLRTAEETAGLASTYIDLGRVYRRLADSPDLPAADIAAAPAGATGSGDGNEAQTADAAETADAADTADTAGTTVSAGTADTSASTGTSATAAADAANTDAGRPRPEIARG